MCLCCSCVAWVQFWVGASIQLATVQSFRTTAQPFLQFPWLSYPFLFAFALHTVWSNTQSFSILSLARRSLFPETHSFLPGQTIPYSQTAFVFHDIFLKPSTSILFVSCASSFRRTATMRYSGCSCVPDRRLARYLERRLIIRQSRQRMNVYGIPGRSLAADL